MEIIPDQLPPRPSDTHEIEKAAAAAAWGLRAKIPKGNTDSAERRARHALEVTADWFDPSYQGPAISPWINASYENVGVLLQIAVGPLEWNPDFKTRAEGVLRATGKIKQSVVVNDTWVPQDLPWALLVEITEPAPSGASGASGPVTMLRWMENPSLGNSF